MIQLPEGFNASALFTEFFQLAALCRDCAPHRLRPADRQHLQELAMTILPSFPKIRRYALLIGFVGLCFLLGMLKRVFL